MGHKKKKERSAIETLSVDEVPTRNKRSHHDVIEECNDSISEEKKESKTKKKKKKSQKNREEATDNKTDCTERDVQSTGIRNGVSHVAEDCSLEETEIFKSKMGHKKKKERNLTESLSDDVSSKKKKRTHDECNEEFKDSTHEVIKKRKAKKKKRNLEDDMEDSAKEVPNLKESSSDDVSSKKKKRTHDECNGEFKDNTHEVIKKRKAKKKKRNLEDDMEDSAKEVTNLKESSSDDVSSKKKKRTHDECNGEFKDSTHEVIKKRKAKKKKRNLEDDIEESANEVTEGDRDAQSTQITGDVSFKEEDSSLPDTDTESEEKRKIKEKKRLKRLAKKAEAKAMKEPILGEVGQIKALEYLRLWKHQRDQWSFQKVRQVWLLQQMYNIDKVSDDNFEILLEYMAGMKGRASKLTLEKAQKLMDSYETTEKDESITETIAGPSQKQYDRAREIIQIVAS